MERNKFYLVVAFCNRLCSKVRITLTYRSQNDMTRSTFEILFSRYKDHERRMSQTYTIQAVNFTEAVVVAGHMLTAMKTTDVDAEFEIVSVSCSGYSRGVVGEIGFETAAEIADKAGA